ncbi:MAG: metallophosphoesterase [Methanomicrobiaceae archaeon]|nr:metallophosphoesterase [Methanomicrobiaceae archaeon]
MNPVFLPEGPALLVEGRLRVLVVADLHFGAEAEFARRGVHIPSNSADRMERVRSCVEAADPDLLLLLGDVKHSIPFTNRQELRELPAILAAFRRLAELRVAPGNHDAGLERFVADDELLPKDGAVIDGTGYLHGHTAPAASLTGRLIVVGHHHPVVHLHDDVGCALRAQPAYLLAEIDGACFPDGAGSASTRALFVPAFFELAGGLDVTRIRASRLSPLSRCIREEGAEVFLNDGTYIDSLEGLRRAAGESPAR